MGSLSPLASSLEWDPVVSITGTLAGEHALFRRLGLQGGMVCPVRHHALRRVTLSPFGTARYGRRAWGRSTCHSAGLVVQVTPHACVLVPAWNYTDLVGSRRLGGSSRVIPPRRTQYAAPADSRQHGLSHQPGDAPQSHLETVRVDQLRSDLRHASWASRRPPARTRLWLLRGCHAPRAAPSPRRRRASSCFSSVVSPPWRVLFRVHSSGFLLGPDSVG